MAIHRVTVLWSGFLGAPGYSAFHFMAGGGLINDAQSSANRVASALANIQPLLPGTVTLTVQPEVEEIDESTGMVTDFINVEAPDPVEGSGAVAYSAPTGAVVNWRTNDLRGGRRIRGRTFLVPLANNAYEQDGTLNVGARQDLQSFADDLLGGDLDSELVVWSRPVGGSGGVAATVVSATVPDMAAVLRSRRD